MQINVSGLLRDFATVRRAALAGKRIVIATREGNLVLTAESQASAPNATSSGGEPLSSVSPTAGGRRFVSRAVLAEATRTAPRIDAQRFRDDLDAVIDSQVDG
jgi:hypothetical protein